MTTPPGYFAPAVASQSALKCSLGYYSSASGSKCLVVPAGFFFPFPFPFAFAFAFFKRQF